MKSNLLISDLNYFVGTRKGTGEFSIFSSSMDLEAFKKYCLDNFGIDGTMNEDNSHLLFKINTLFDNFIQNIVTEIREQNDSLFKNLLDHNQNGVIRHFASDYNRIKDGEISENYPLRLELNKLIEHHLKIFLSLDIYKSNKINFNIYFELDSIKNSFAILVNLLCMSIMIEYKISKKYFKHDLVFKDNINQIKEKLYSFFLEPLQRNDLDEFYAYCLFENPNLLSKFLNIRNLSLDLHDCQRALNKFTHEVYKTQSYSNYMEMNQYKLTLPKDFGNIFANIIDMMGIINMVDYMYEKLKESCDTDNSDVDNEIFAEFNLLFLK